MSLGEFAWSVFFYCSMTRASVNDWIRTPTRNAKLEGVQHSPHLVGLGVDVVYDSPVALDERVEWAARAGLRLIMRPGHDHLQPLEWKAG